LLKAASVHAPWLMHASAPCACTQTLARGSKTPMLELLLGLLLLTAIYFISRK
jgi:hypothetical protein